MQNVNWTLWAGAAAAAGWVGTGETDAAIIYNPTELLNEGGESDYDVDPLNANGPEFTIDNSRNQVTGEQTYYLKNTSNGFQYGVTDSQMKPFAAGEVIGDDDLFSDAGTPSSHLAGESGLFPTDSSTAYIGFSFNPGGVGIRYGWVAVSMTDPANNLSDPQGLFTILGSAYEDSGAPIMAGDTGIPEPASLVLLAAGAGALGTRRRTQ